ncbi:MAG: hypothetical protein KDA25_12675 [Phycisphaerales bacterium]|nr:hypothetical protein [Phycisphaerales bacterium]
MTTRNAEAQVRRSRKDERIGPPGRRPPHVRRGIRHPHDHSGHHMHRGDLDDPFRPVPRTIATGRRPNITSLRPRHDHIVNRA